VTEKRLGREDNQRLTDRTLNLTTENVEVVGSGGHVDDLPVSALDASLLELRVTREEGRIVVTALEEALHACGGVLSTLTFVAVGEEEDEAGLTVPLVFSGGHVVIEDDLSAVDEVTELSFPDHQLVGVLKGVTVVEAKSAIFTKE
jgi:hypothetical protein